jgi:hypothetical protein
VNQEARPRAAVELDTQRRQVVAELMSTIKSHYPSAAFGVRKGIDDPEATYITAIVDIDDPDEVLDLLEDRLLALQIGEGMPVYVLPVHTPERVAQTMQRLRQREHASALLLA